MPFSVIVIPVKAFAYSAKFVCGYSNASGGPVLNGNYATAINVHNPQALTTANFRKKVVIALPEGRPIKGNISNFMLFSLKPDEAFEIDCADIADILKNSNITMPSLAKGFVVIQSPKVDLDVVGVYTAGGANVESIDVETVNPKTIFISSCARGTINLNTGFNQTTASVIPTGGMDDDWMVTVSPLVPVAPPSRFADVVPFTTWGWAPPFATSNWISIDPNRGHGGVTGKETFTYQYNFTLPQCITSANLNGTSRADDEGKIYLNGIFVSNIGGPFPTSPLFPFTTSLGFIPGQQNTLKVVVNDTQGIVTGFDLVGTVTYS